jgi:4-amino-4-deoxy-L-arabinose transferase-like glycosyltransferase
MPPLLRAGILVTILALIWLGLSLLRTDPALGLVGWLSISLGLAGFAGLLAPQRVAAWLPAQLRHRLTHLNTVAPSVLFYATALLGAVATLILNNNPALKPWGSLTTWLVSLACLLAGAWRAKRSTELETAAPQATRLAGWEWIGISVALLLALGLRVYQLGEIPVNFAGDEGEMGSTAREVLTGKATDVFRTGWFSHPMLWFFAQAGSLGVFGNSVFGLRMLSALLGTATVAVLYLFARPVFGPMVALLAAFLLAGFHAHVHYSRVALNNIVDPLTALVAGIGLFLALRRQQPFGLALTGIMLGLGIHFYMGARLMPLVFAALWIYLLIWQRPLVRALGWNWLLVPVGFALALGPLSLFFWEYPQDFNARLAMVGVVQSGWLEGQLANGRNLGELVLDQLGKALGFYTHEIDRSALYYPEMPILDLASTVLFLFGALTMLTSARRPESVWVVIWLVGAAVFGGALLINPPESPRYVTTYPAICLVMALGLVRLTELTGLAQRWQTTISVVLVSGVLLWNTHFYFNLYTPRAIYGWQITEIGTEIGRYLAETPESRFTYFLGAPVMYFGNGSMRFIAPTAQGTDLLETDVQTNTWPTAVTSLPPRFIALEGRRADLSAVQNRFPGGQIREITSRWNGKLLFLVYEP